MRATAPHHQNYCRDATKIDKTRLATSTRLRRVAKACQSSLHTPGSVVDEVLNWLLTLESRCYLSRCATGESQPEILRVAVKLAQETAARSSGSVGCELRNPAMIFSSIWYGAIATSRASLAAARSWSSRPATASSIQLRLMPGSSPPHVATRS